MKLIVAEEAAFDYNFNKWISEGKGRTIEDYEGKTYCKNESFDSGRASQCLAVYDDWACIPDGDDGYAEDKQSASHGSGGGGIAGCYCHVHKIF